MLALTDSAAASLSGTLGTSAGPRFPIPGELAGPVNRAMYQMTKLAASAAAGLVYQTSAAAVTVGVLAAQFYDGSTLRTYAGSSSEALTDDATNYLYIDRTGSLVTNTSGFPTAAPHVPLAEVVLADAAISSITDRRQRSLLGLVGTASAMAELDWLASVLDAIDMTSAEPASPTAGDRYLNTAAGSSSETSQTVAANAIYQWDGSAWIETVPTEGAAVLVEDVDTLYGFDGSAWVALGTFANLRDLTDGGNADALHTHGAAGIENGSVDTDELADDAVTAAKIDDGAVGTDALTGSGVTAVKLADAVADAIVTVTVTPADDADGTGSLTIQAVDAQGNALAAACKVRVWIGGSDDYGSDAITGFTVTTGTLFETTTANADLTVITDATGLAVIDVNNGAAGTLYAWAEIGGKIVAATVTLTA